MTNYTILRWNQDAQAWKEHGAADASSPKRALTVANVDEGGYVAVPTREWRPLLVKVEQTRKVTIE